MNTTRETTQNLIIVATVDLYSRKYNMSATDTIRLFKKHDIFNALRESYDVLHTMDIGDGLRFVEDYLAGESKEK